MKTSLRFLTIAAVCLLVGFAAPVIHDTGCGNGEDSTFTVYLPPALEYQTDTTMRADSIVIPNGRPIYALLVQGFTQNKNFDLLLCYNFARHLMQKGAYVHYAWWNNLCGEYMGRPLHQDNSHPGAFAPGGFLPVLGEDSTYGDKARPAEDYQFQADAAALLEAIRDNNPSAIIIVAGHSMGGAAVSRLGSNTDVLIDILAPLDPVENRGVPMGRMPLIPQVLYEPPIPPVVFPDYNFTRWRIAHEEFRGYKQHYCIEPNGLLCDECGGLGDRWYGYYELPLPHSLHVDCGYAFYGIPWWNPYVDSPPRRQFRRNIVNLFHRYQKEYMFPFDYLSDEHFDHDPPPGGSTSQSAVTTCWIGWNAQIDELCWGTD
jgi:pimeloyl-ACP methyl ester carboxylesterase